MGEDITFGEPDYSPGAGGFESLYEGGESWVDGPEAHPPLAGPCPCIPPERVKNWSENVIVGTPMMFCTTHGGTRTIHTTTDEGLCDWAWGLKNKGGEPVSPCALMWKLVSLIPGEGIIED